MVEQSCLVMFGLVVYICPTSIVSFVFILVMVLLKVAPELFFKVNETLRVYGTPISQRYSSAAVSPHCVPKPSPE